MDEFVALVLGSALAVVGGIIGTLFTHWLSNKKELKKERKEAYSSILKFCYRLKYIDSKSNKDITYDYLTEIASKTLLYASDKVSIEYEKIHYLTSELLRATDENDKEKIKELRQSLNAHIDIISAQMKKELKLETKRSKELLSQTMDKNIKEKRKNGN